MEALAGALPNSSFLDIDRVAVGNASSNVSSNASSVLSNETLQQCVDKKKELTSQVVAARQLARDGRSKVALLNSTIKVLSAWESMLETEVYQALDVNNDFQEGWAGLKQGIDNQVYESAFADSKVDLEEVTENVSNYVGLDTVHGSALPSMMSSLEKKLQSFDDNIHMQMTNLLADYAFAESHLEANIGTVSKELSELQEAAAPLQANLSSAQAFVDQAVQHEQELLSERAAAEAECEQALW
jgi:chromosome segregation ATPase